MAKRKPLVCKKCGNTRICEGRGVFVCRTCKYAKADVWRQNNTLKMSDIWKRSRLKRKYGLTLEQFDLLVQQYEGACGICRVILTASGPTKLCIDHNHITNGVRGLLCHRCNCALGQMLDSPTLLRRAASYLESF